jgi:hypothetical protein
MDTPTKEQLNPLAAMTEKELTEKDLLPCPFCGSDEFYLHDQKSNDGTITWYRIYHGATTECSMSMLNSNKQRLFELWNNRDGYQQAEIERLTSDKEKDIEALIKSIHVDKANFEHISKTGIINGTLLTELMRIFKK